MAVRHLVALSETKGSQFFHKPSIMDICRLLRPLVSVP